MARRGELFAEAKRLGIETNQQDSNADLEAKIAAGRRDEAPVTPDPGSAPNAGTTVVDVAEGDDFASTDPAGDRGATAIVTPEGGAPNDAGRPSVDEVSKAALREQRATAKQRADDAREREEAVAQASEEEQARRDAQAKIAAEQQDASDAHANRLITDPADGVSELSDSQLETLRTLIVEQQQKRALTPMPGVGLREIALETPEDQKLTDEFSAAEAADTVNRQVDGSYEAVDVLAKSVRQRRDPDSRLIGSRYLVAVTGDGTKHVVEL